MSLDRILNEHVGSCGLWQKLVISAAGLAALGSAFLRAMPIFTEFVPAIHGCKVDQCDAQEIWPSLEELLMPHNLSNPRCYIFPWINRSSSSDHEEKLCLLTDFDTDADPVVCQAHEYDKSHTETNYGLSIVTQLELASCDPDGEVNDVWRQPMSFLSVGSLIGLMVGGLIGGLVSDLWGRRKTLVLLTVAAGALSFAGSFATDYWTYFSLRLLTSLCGQGSFVTSFVMAVEIVVTDYRSRFVIIIQLFKVLGEVLVVPAAFFLGKWSTLQITLSSVVCVLGAALIAMPESPRWLMAKNKLLQAQQVLSEAAKLNGRTFPKDYLSYVAGDLVIGDPKLQYGSLRDTWQGGKWLVLLCLISLNTGMGYFGLKLPDTNAILCTNIYLNAFFMVLIIDLPANMMCLVMIRFLGRKFTLIGCLCLSGIFCVASFGVGVSALQDVGLACSLLGQLAASASVTVIYIVTAEVCQTTFRGRAMGCVSLASFAGPLITHLLPHQRAIIVLVAGLANFAAALLVALIPGTKLPGSDAQVGATCSCCWVGPAEEVGKGKAAEINAGSTDYRPRIPDIVIEQPSTVSEVAPESTFEVEPEQVPSQVKPETKVNLPEAGHDYPDRQADASRKLSQLAPASVSNPLAVRVGQFAVIPTEGKPGC